MAGMDQLSPAVDVRGSLATRGEIGDIKEHVFVSPDGRILGFGGMSVSGLKGVCEMRVPAETAELIVSHDDALRAIDAPATAGGEAA